MRFVLKVLPYVLGGTIAFVVAATLFYHRRMTKRVGVPRDDFVAAFSAMGVPKHLPGAVYDYYKGSGNLRIAPDDAYQELLKGEADIAVDAELLVRKLELKPLPQGALIEWATEFRTRQRTSAPAPNFQASSASWTQPIQTVGDMVLWLDWVRSQQPS